MVAYQTVRSSRNGTSDPSRRLTLSLARRRPPATTTKSHSVAQRSPRRTQHADEPASHPHQQRRPVSSAARQTRDTEPSTQPARRPTRHNQDSGSTAVIPKIDPEKTMFGEKADAETRSSSTAERSERDGPSPPRRLTSRPGPTSKKRSSPSGVMIQQRTRTRHRHEKTPAEQDRMHQAKMMHQTA